MFDDILKELKKEFNDTTSEKDDIIELEDKFLIEVELPGVKKSDIEISIKPDFIFIEAKHIPRDNSKRYIRKARNKSDFSKKYIIGEGIDIDKISATFEDGLLILDLPKGGELKTRKVDIN